ILYVALAGGPDSQKTEVATTNDAMKVVPVTINKPSAPPPHVEAPPVDEKPTPAPDDLPANANPAGSAVLKPLPPDD
ncbi:MAG TPA: hypothetical protein VGC41_22315, partial [Kofleriaceae bacterium]